MTTERDKWLEDRQNSVGGSEAAAVIGRNPYMSRHALWQQKTGASAPVVANTIMRFGTHCEPFIDELYCQEMSRETVDLGRYTIQRRQDWPDSHATIDRQIMPCPGYSMPGVAQYKNTGMHLRSQWLEEPPIHVQIQLQHELFVSKMEWGSAAALIGGTELIVHDVERDDKFCDFLAHKCAEFMYWVREGIEPPATDGDLEAVKAYYPQSTSGEDVMLHEDSTALTEVILKAKERIKKDEMSVEGNEARLRQLIGSAEQAEVPGYDDMHWVCKTMKKKGFEVKPSTSRPLRWAKTK